MSIFAEYYATGTIAVTNGSATVTLTGGSWNDVVQGDVLEVAGRQQTINSLTDATHLELMLPYGGTTGSGLSHVLWKASKARFDPSLALATFKEYREKLAASTLLYSIPEGELPDNGVGDDGQIAIRVDTTGITVWKRITGAYVLQVQPIATVAAAAPSPRLSLTSGTAITTADVTGATSVFVSSAGQNATPIYNGTADAARATPSEATLTLNTGGHVANTAYDVFEAWVSGAYFVGTGPAWTNSGAGTSARSAAVHSFNGRRTNTASILLRNGATTTTVAADQANLLGGFKTLAVAGTTEDSAAKRFLWNEYNSIQRPLSRVDTTDSWTYAAGAAPGWRQARASTLNQVEIFSGASGRPVEIFVGGSGTSPGGLVAYAVGIGINSTTVNSAQVLIPSNTNGATVKTFTCFARYRGFLPLGYNTLVWLESRDASEIVTWGGDFGATYIQSGMDGRVIL